MKKFVGILFIFTFSLILFACTKVDTELLTVPTEKVNVNFSIADFNLVNDEGKEWVSFNVIAETSVQLNVEFDLSYVYYHEQGAYIDASLTSLASFDGRINRGTNLLDFKIELKEENYDDYIYIKLENNSDKYNYIIFKMVDKSLISIALDVLSKDANNEIAKKIDDTINTIDVSSIEMSIDYDNKKVQALGAGYVLNADFSDDYIIVEIVFSSKAHLTNDFDKLAIKVNNESAKGNLYIDNNKYYYKEEVEKTNTDVIINSISLTFDYLKHSEEIKKAEYTALMSNPEYNKITITITLNSGYVFSSDLSLTINDKNIDKSLYKIDNSVLTYIFDDPNWSGFY